MMKKLLAVFLSMAMVAILMTGCGKSTTKKNLGDVEVYSFYEANFYNEDGSYNLKNATGIAAKKYEEMYGGKVKFTKIAYADYASTLQNLIAANTQPDMVAVYWGDMPGWGINILQPIDDYIDVSKLNNQKIVEAYAVNGKHYSLSVQQIQVQLLWYNRAVFERYGIEKTPYELWKDGEWTWDKFVEIAKELTQDIDGDGQTDMYGFISNDPQIYHYSNNAPFIKVDASNVKLDWASEASLHAFDIYSKMLNEYKCMDPNGENIHSGAFENEQAAMAYGTFEFPFFRASGMDVANIGCAPFPTGPDFEGDYYCTSNMFGLTQGAKNPEGACALAKLIEEASAEFDMGMDLGNNKATEMLDDEAKEVVKYVNQNVTLAMDRGWGNFIESFLNVYSACSKGENMKTALDSNHPAAMAEINDTLTRLEKSQNNTSTSQETEE